MALIIGIDHGLKGGLCILNPDGSIKDLLPLPEHHLFLSYMSHLKAKHAGHLRVYLEELSINPKFARQACTTMARNLGKLEGILNALEIPVSLVSPQRWQGLMFEDERVKKAVGHPKARSFVAVKTLYPDIDLIPPGKRTEHDGMADACLIARYGHIMETSQELS